MGISYFRPETQSPPFIAHSDTPGCSTDDGATLGGAFLGRVGFATDPGAGGVVERGSQGEDFFSGCLVVCEV